MESTSFQKITHKNISLIPDPVFSISRGCLDSNYWPSWTSWSCWCRHSSSGCSWSCFLSLLAYSCCLRQGRGCSLWRRRSNRKRSCSRWFLSDWLRGWSSCCPCSCSGRTSTPARGLGGCGPGPWGSSSTTSWSFKSMSIKGKCWHLLRLGINFSYTLYTFIPRDNNIQTFFEDWN